MSRVKDLLEQAAEWRLIGLLFECPSLEWRVQVAAVASDVEDETLRGAAESALVEADEGMHHSIFGPGGPAPARQASYQESLELGFLMSGLSEYYGAFAYRPALSEAVDHVAVQVGFVAYLHFKEAFAMSCGDSGRALVCREAISSFLTDHLSTMAEPLAACLAHSGISYLASASQALLSRVGPRRKSSLTTNQQPFAILPNESEFGCGGAESGAGL
jgi:hypothetical protein